MRPTDERVWTRQKSHRLAADSAPPELPSKERYCDTIVLHNVTLLKLFSAVSLRDRLTAVALMLVVYSKKLDRVILEESCGCGL